MICVLFGSIDKNMETASNKMKTSYKWWTINLLNLSTVNASGSNYFLIVLNSDSITYVEWYKTNFDPQLSDLN